MAYLLGAGLLRPSQVSATYGGTPDQMVTNEFIDTSIGIK